MWRRIFYRWTGAGFILAFAMGFAACPKRLVGGYQIINGKVIYQTGMKGLGTTHSFELEGADAETFRVITRHYGKDSRNAYLKGKKIPDSHGPTFRIVELPFATDKNHVYFAAGSVNKPRILKKADAPTFELVSGENGIDARDENNRYNFGTIRRKRK